jgi:hypothetical protein
VSHEVTELRGLLADDRVWCIVAEEDGRLAGQVTVLPAAIGPRPMRLFVASGQRRARRFYEREGWRAASEPFLDPGPGLEIVEYRYVL